MLTVRDLFCRVTWEGVAEMLAKRYPDCDVASHRPPFEFIRRAVPRESSMTVCIEWRQDEDGGYWDVFGRIEGDPQGYALELSLLSDWAGYLVDPSVLERFAPEEAAAHILYEATFCSYTDAEIAACRREIENRVKEMKQQLTANEPEDGG